MIEVFNETESFQEHWHFLSVYFPQVQQTIGKILLGKIVSNVTYHVKHYSALACNECKYETEEWSWICCVRILYNYEIERIQLYLNY